MNKKILSGILAAALSLSTLAFAAEENSKVEISFKVGDSILSINGAKTEVETPYIAGAGTTLVPLRVITESFGAQVDWEGETKTITLTYPDVNIVLQIDNIIAKVNDHSETLPEAPALSQNGVTMVPLRFISETFGATVNYDNETGGILVTKENIGSSQTVMGSTDLARTGDSYYNWSIDTPTLMKMTDRSLDGLSTEFTADNDSTLYIDVYKETADTIVPFEESFSRIKDSFSKYTLTEAEKLTDDSGNKYMHFQAKDKDKIIDFCEYFGKDFTVYDVIAEIKSDDTSVKDMIISLSKSFRLGAIDNQTYDLSSVSDNMRLIKDDTYKVSFKIPADYKSVSSGGDNEFRFIDTTDKSNAYVALGIYSKTDSVTAQLIAQHDHDSRVNNSNPAFSTVSDVNLINDKYVYTQTIKGSSFNDIYSTDTFFEKGDYVYNFTVSVNSEKDSALVKTILDSLEIEELDSSKTGKIMRNDSEDTTISVKAGDYKFDIPASWKKLASSPSGTSNMFVHDVTGSSMSVLITENSNIKKANLNQLANDLKKSIISSEDVSLEKDISYSTINNTKMATFVYKTKNKERVSYSTIYLYCENNKAFSFSLTQDECIFGSSENNTFAKVVESFMKDN